MFPKSSRIYLIATNYKNCYVNFMHKSDSFFSRLCTKFFKHFKVNHDNTRRTSINRYCFRKLSTKQSWGFNHNVTNYTSYCKQYCASQRNLLLAGDVELNPGPSTYNKTSDVVTFLSMRVLELRLHQFGIRPMDACWWCWRLLF